MAVRNSWSIMAGFPEDLISLVLIKLLCFLA